MTDTTEDRLGSPAGDAEHSQTPTAEEAVGREGATAEPEPGIEPTVPSTSSPLGLVGVVGVLALLGWATSWTVVVFVLALIVSIILHECGHYWMAKRAGMKVTEFFVGMGPRVWSVRRGEVEYGIKAFPIGAYVRIIGMNNLDLADPAEEDRTYRSKSYPRRLAVVLAGPAANLAIGVTLFFGIFAFQGQPDRETWVVGEVVEGTAAAGAGVVEGDRVVAVDGVDVSQWEALGPTLNARAGQVVELEVERGGERVVLTPTLGWSLNEAGASAIPSSPPLRSGDRVLEADGAPVASYDELRATLAADGAPVTLVVEQGTQRYLLENVDRPLTLPTEGARGFLGVSPGFGTVDLALHEAAGESVLMVRDLGFAFAEGLGRLFSPSGLSQYASLFVEDSAGSSQGAEQVETLRPVGEAPAATASEPPPERPISIIGIVQLGGQSAETGGWVSALWVLALVNVILALLNLIPLLPFDGGHAAVATYEAIRGAIARQPYRVDMAKLMPLTYAVVFLLLGLGLSSMWLDVTNPIELP